MQIERHAIDSAARAPRKPGACLGCADCRGTCWSLAEFLYLPEVILRPRRTAPA